MVQGEQTQVIQPLKSWKIKDHALFQMGRRDIKREMVDSVLRNPEQAKEIKTGRVVYQRRFRLGDPPKTYLLRVFADVDRSPAEVVTVYKTSRMEKYWEDL